MVSRSDHKYDNARLRSLTLVDIVCGRAQSDPDGTAYIFRTYSSAGLVEEERITYDGLARRAKAIAAILQKEGLPGDRVLILCPSGLAYIAAFFGCQFAGMTAVPAYPPRNAKHMGRLHTIVSDASAAVILAPASTINRLIEWAGGSEKLRRLISCDTISDDAALDWINPGIGPNELAFLQYTSGTTSTPKGVMVKHAQVIDNVDHIMAEWDVGSDSTLALWLPPYHDMGLVNGLILPVAIGATSVLMSPVSFLHRPARWLEAIDNHNATHILAPNFAYQMCCDRISDQRAAEFDLRSITSAALSAEPIRLDTLRAFTKKFAAAGFTYETFATAYGMAETVCLIAASRLPSGPKALSIRRSSLAVNQITIRAPLSSGLGEAVPDTDLTDSLLTVVSCGHVIDGHEMRIVDPDSGRECLEGQVGEVWVSGPSVAAGYWEKPETTAATFGARLVEEPAGQPFLRTGDLGCLIRGELYILGRTKELIIVRGLNHYAQDIEATAAASDPTLGSDRTAAFGIDDNGEERVVLVHELTRTTMRNLDARKLALTMRRLVVDVHEVDVSVVEFVRPASLPRTTSGKIQRVDARERFLSGALSVVAEWRA